MSYWADKRILITGGSAGLGLAISRAFALQGARVAIIGRNQATLDSSAAQLSHNGSKCLAVAADVTEPDAVEQAFSTIRTQWGGLDVLVNNAGRSSRGTIAETSPEEFRQLWELNFLATLRCTQAALPMLLESRGHVVNIGSLGAKTASKFLGAYPTSKFPVAALSQQLRLEHKLDGLHVLLVCPGPITRDDAGNRYADQASGLPDSAALPGGGVKVKTIDPEWLAKRIVKACERRELELVVPGKARLLFAISQMFPAWGDWIVERMTSKGK